MALATGLLGACSGSAVGTGGDELERIMVAVSWAGHGVTSAEMASARSSDEIKRKMLKRVLIDPITRAGYDPDRSIQVLTDTYLNLELPEEKASDIASFLGVYAECSTDLQRLDLILPETAWALHQFNLSSGNRGNDAKG